MKAFISGMVFGIIFGVLANHAMAQTLAPVANVGGFDWWPLVIFGVFAVAIAGMVIWHQRNPSGQANALGEIHADLANVIRRLHETLEKKDVPTSVVVATPPPEPAQPPGPTPEQLAAIETAQSALDAAKRAAGQ